MELLLLGRRRFRRLVNYERLNPGEFLLEAGDKVLGPVLKEHNKTEGEKHEQSHPEDGAKQAHAGRVTYSCCVVNDPIQMTKFLFELASEAAIIFPHARAAARS